MIDERARTPSHGSGPAERTTVPSSSTASGTPVRQAARGSAGAGGQPAPAAKARRWNASDARGPKPTSLRLEASSREARRRAAVILEVLSGERSPNDGAEALEVSAPRYYALEARALRGFIAYCEPAPKGRVVKPENRIEDLSRENERLRRECARYQSLFRAAHRTVGIAAPPRETPSAAPGKGGKHRRRRRRGQVRALRVAAQLRTEPAHNDAAVPACGSQTASAETART